MSRRLPPLNSLRAFGTVDLEGVDTAEDDALSFTNTLTAVPREPDAIRWLDADRFVTANEGDWQGSRAASG